MLPRSTNTRKKRDIKVAQKLDGRSSEIQRLIGRALRAVVDREALGERQIIDCDVIQADGGTRCASITGGYAALYLACRKLVDEGVIEKNAAHRSGFGGLGRYLRGRSRARPQPPRTAMPSWTATSS